MQSTRAHLHSPLWAYGQLLLTACALACTGDDGASTSETGPPSTGPATTDTVGTTVGPTTTEPTTTPTSTTAPNTTNTTNTTNPTTTTSPTTTDPSDTDPSDTDPTESTTGVPGCALGDVLTQAHWDEMFLHKEDPACSGSIYTYPGLVDAATDYPTFACEGDVETRTREVAAFLAQISHETTGGWPQAPDGPYAWGLCFIEEVGCENNQCPQYCDANNMQYPCAPGKTYHGRGAIQLSWNYNYGQAGDALGVDLLADPDLVANDSTLAIQTALWFWMTEQLPKPSAHDVMVGNWTPTPQDEALGRVPGFGMTTNIINGGLECGFPTPPAVEDRVGFFGRYADILGTTTGDNLYCDQMTPY